MVVLNKKIDWLKIITISLFIILIIAMLIIVFLSTEENKKIAHCKLICANRPDDAILINGECWCSILNYNKQTNNTNE